MNIEGASVFTLRTVDKIVNEIDTKKKQVVHWGQMKLRLNLYQEAQLKYTIVKNAVLQPHGLAEDEGGAKE